VYGKGKSKSGTSCTVVRGEKNTTKNQGIGRNKRTKTRKTKTAPGGGSRRDPWCGCEKREEGETKPLRQEVTKSLSFLHGGKKLEAR